MRLPVFPFTDRDSQVIKDWAKDLDDWLVSSNRTVQPVFSYVRD